MSPDIFQRALLATARVACCAALISCASRPEEKKEPQNTPTVVPPSAPATVVASAPLSAPASSMAASAPTSEATSLASCEAHVKNVFVAKAAAPSEETKACCQKVAENVGLDTSKWAERDQCCSLLGWNGPIACTPWGPPCPPAMSA